MSTTDTVPACPRCELRFSRPVELLDHVRRDHPAPLDEVPIPQGRVVLAVDPARPDPVVAVRVASALAAQLGAALDIVAAGASGPTDATTQSYLQERVRECRAAGALWVSWHDLGSSPPAGAVIAHAAGVPMTWICLASHARTAVGEKFHGSVASDILGAATVPVVVVGPNVISADEPFTRIVACVDRSPAAPAVAAGAADLAERLDARLVLVEVSIPTINGDALLDDRHLRALEHDLGRDAETVLLPGHREWLPILDFVRDDPTTVLVTGRRPATAPGRFVTGSVAINLARRAHGPVMIVPPPSAAA